MLTHSVEADELARIRARYGPGPLEDHRLEVDAPFLTGPHQRLTSAGRRAEICYVMHQGDPGAGVLLHAKTIYPPGIYRLPTGGVRQEEPVLETLVREVMEETGLQVAMDGRPGPVQVQRFLGVLRYRLFHRSSRTLHRFATYHFLLQAPPDPRLEPQDPDEKIAGWKWLPSGDLWAVADELAGVAQRAPAWGDWGRFRAISHRFVAQQLTST